MRYTPKASRALALAGFRGALGKDYAPVLTTIAQIIRDGVAESNANAALVDFFESRGDFMYPVAPEMVQELINEALGRPV